MADATGKSTFSDASPGACFGGDNARGHRGYAYAKRGAKKYVRTRIRFHDKAATRKLAREQES